MSAALCDMACDIGLRVRSARAVAQQIDEVIPTMQGEHYERRCEAGYLLAAVIDLLDMVANSAEVLEVELKSAARAA